uniref:Uncharacterized protein n=1 Tax=Oryza sativa subsp. japonica TaxID=39947 RepID=Q2QMS2_ORYSJ|nr:hypothetical protein LOC_Os12g40220 [Oryza sativa Japonica Group]
MDFRTTETEESAESKTLEFRSFHSCQETRSTRESKPAWRCSVKQALEDGQQSWNQLPRGKEGSPAKRRQHTEPDLPSKHTVEEDVVRRLKILSAKRTGLVTINATLLEKISRPAALL